jgi:polar amino acid transport system substrate-binding protein
MKKALALILALMMALALVACGSNSAGTDGGDGATGDKLVLGTSADYAPFEFMYADENGDMQYAGIDVSAAKYIAESMGKELQIENMSFDYLLTSLAKGDYDMVMAAMEATEERQQSADFSDPYYTDLPAMILVKADKADQYKTLADFAGKSVGAQTATTKADIVTNDMEGANLVSLAVVTDLVNELVYDKVDAVVLDGAVATEYANSNDDLVIAPASAELGSAEPYCVAVAKGDPKGLLPAINEAIAKMQAENAVETFIADADALSGVAVEVSADAPAS